MARRSGADLSNAHARRIALAAQGFCDPRPAGRVDRRHLRRVLDRIGLIQIDSVNVLVRSQELPLFARLGPHPRSLIPDATAAGELFEYWVHEASHVRTDHYQLHRWQMRAPHRWASFRELMETRGDYIEQVYRQVLDRGAVVAGDLRQRVGTKGTWWDYDDGKIALEALFHEGRLTAWRRPNDFARVYDVTERVIPAEVLARPALPEHEARKELLALAARYHGIGTLKDLADYHRLKPSACAVAIAELVDDGRLRPVTVEGWKDQAYLHPDATVPRRVNARALLSPFDPVVWNRERALRLFGFHYRIEIYTPAHKRQYGYYVLPFLLGDEIVGRVDLKADRANGALLVQAAWVEPGIPELDVAAELMAELHLMAGWLGLNRVEVSGKGDLAQPLAALAASSSSTSVAASGTE
jgi:uncharacterized protein YcaQ